MRLTTGDLRGAVTDFTLSIEADPQLTLAHNNRGLAKSKLGDLEGALVDYTNSIAIAPSLPWGYFHRASARLDLAELHLSRAADELARQYWTSALADLDLALTLEPKDYQSHSERGFVLFRLGHHRAALQSIDLSIDMAPYDSLAYFRRAQISAHQKDNSMAILDLEQYLAHSSDRSKVAEACVLLGRLLPKTRFNAQN
jgi:tetratricopeptide (TPR) repeat protein